MSHIPGRARTAAESKRKSRGLKEFTRVLIACEGEKTEPHYLRDLCRSLSLTTAFVEITGKECGSSPKSIYEYADLRWREDGGFDEIYCVFDRDSHETFDEALVSIRQHRSKRMQQIVSYPCFEYWIFLHFGYARPPCIAVGARSAGARMLELLLNRWPEYAKGSKDVFTELDKQGLTDAAIRNAVRARVDAERTGDPDPSTQIDILICRLRELAKEKDALSFP